ETVIESAIEEFRDRAISVLRTQGHDVGRAQFESSVDLRFKGQSYEINVPIRGDLRRAFHRAHRLRYGYASRTEAIEVATVRLVVRMPRPIRQPRPPPPSESRPQVRRVLFDDGWHDAPVHDRARLGVGG